MNFVKEIKGMLRDKNGKKLALLSFGVFVLIAAIVFFAAFKLCENIYIKQMNDYLGEIPGMIESSRKELDLRGRIYDDDVLTRAELGLKIYREGGRLSDQEKLERVRGAVSVPSDPGGKKAQIGALSRRRGSRGGDVEERRKGLRDSSGPGQRGAEPGL